MLIDIVILPPKDIRRKIGTKIKKEIENLPNFFVVDNIKLIPHLSLWHMKTSENKINKIARELEEIIKEQKFIKVTSSKFDTSEKYKGYLGFSIKKNKDLITLREKVVQKIYLYKTGIMPGFATFLGIKDSKEKLREIKIYGRALGFDPHFTMGWLKDKKDVLKVIKRMKKVEFNFLAKEIYICEVDKWWQVKRIIKKIDF